MRLYLLLRRLIHELKYDVRIDLFAAIGNPGDPLKVLLFCFEIVAKG